MKPALFLLPALLLPMGLVPAQFSRAIVTPLGAEFEEGYAASAVQFGFNNQHDQSRTQQVDKGFIGYPFPMILRGIGWRRDGRTRPNSIKRTGDLEVLMSHCDFSKVTNLYYANYKDKPVTVFKKKKVNLPDWTAAPPFKPAGFDLVLPFDVPFIYNRKDALLYDLKVTNLSSKLTYHMDFYRNNQLKYGFGQYPFRTGSGCRTKNGEMVQSTCLRADSGGLELLFRLWGAPSAAQVYALVGYKDPNLSVPGLCARLHTNSLLVFPVAKSLAGGEVWPTRVVRAPWSTAFIGAVFYTQCLALDSSLPYGVALSSAQRCPAPTANAKSSLPTHMIWNYSSASALSGYLDKLTCCPTIFLY